MKTVCSTKEKYLTETKCLQEWIGSFFVKRRVMVRAGVPPSITKETVHRFL